MAKSHNSIRTVAIRGYGIIAASRLVLWFWHHPVHKPGELEEHNFHLVVTGMRTRFDGVQEGPYTLPIILDPGNNNGGNATFP